jgi:glycosyltransferase involved in cell wall biosynthesis
VHPKKGLDLLIPAFARAGDEDATLVIAGPVQDGYEPVVRGLIRDAGIERRVVLTGMLSGRPRLAAFAAADLFALTSRQENFGMVVIEALACGTPVMLSDQVNIWRDVVDANVGAAVPLDVERIAATLRQWLSDDAGRRAAAAARARAFVAEHYDWRQIGPRWVRRYEEVVARPPVY